MVLGEKDGLGTAVLVRRNAGHEVVTGARFEVGGSAWAPFARMNGPPSGRRPGWLADMRQVWAANPHTVDVGHHWAEQATPHALGREKGAQGVAVAESSLATDAPIRPRDLRLIGRPDDDPHHPVRRPSPGRKRRIGSFVRGTAVFVAGIAVAVAFGFFIRFWWGVDRRVVLLRRYSTHASLPSRTPTAA